MTIRHLATVTVTIITLFCTFPSAFAAQKKPLVYIVHSYEINHVCGKPQADGILSVLMDQGLYPDKIDVMSYSMDTKRTNVTAEAIAEQGRQALAEIHRLNPTVVVTLDDNAFAHVGMKLIGNDHISVVFSGLNGQPEQYDTYSHFMESRALPSHNVTGVYERLHLKRAIKVLTSIIPNMQNVVGITDRSPTGDAVTKQFEIEASEGLAAGWQVKRVSTFDEYKKLINTINDDPSIQAIYPVALTLDDHGKRVADPEIFRWTIQHSLKPEIPLNYFFCRLGLFGGAAVDFEYMGKVAGTQVSAILQGMKAGSLPIVEASNYAIVFNAERAKMLGITIPMEVLLASDSVFKQIELFQ